MSWENESILVLVEAAPNWSDKHGSYIVCTAGVNENCEWRRLYPMPLESIQGRVHRWDWITVKTAKPDRDIRSESRKIDPSSLEVSEPTLVDREKRRTFLDDLSENSLTKATEEKRSITLLKPKILGFDVIERETEVAQLTLDGDIFEKRPFGNVSLNYKWQCEEPCEVCAKHPHDMDCFDWGANILWKRYEKNKEEAKKKVTQMCYYDMKDKYDTWFVLGTHSKRPFSVWMIVGLIWMKRRV
jgi:hypothetical protein